jgi:hypothetical protein
MSDNKVIPLDPAQPPDGHPRAPRTGRVIGLAIAAALTLGWLTRPPAPPADWTLIALPEAGSNIESLIATPNGFALASGADRSGGAVWTSLDATTWNETAVPRAPTRIVSDGEDLVGYDARTAFRLSPDGTVTDLPLPELLRTGYGSGRAGLIAGDRELLVHTVMGDIHRSFADRPFLMVVNADRWRTATDITLGSRCDPPGRTGPDLPPIVTTEDGFYAYVAANDASGVWPMCEPVAWTSGDGAIWKRESAESPFGRGAYITDLDATANRFVALGGFGFDDPAVWVSDGGLEWERTDSPRANEAYELIEVEGGPAGWIAVGKRSDRPGFIAWISPDGRCWEPLPEDVAGRTVAVGPASFLIADRSTPGTAWLGTPNSLPLRSSC